MECAVEEFEFGSSTLFISDGGDGKAFKACPVVSIPSSGCRVARVDRREIEHMCKLPRQAEVLALGREMGLSEEEIKERIELTGGIRSSWCVKDRSTR